MSEDHPLVQQLVQHLRVVLRHPIHIGVALLVGAVGSFVYSYGPLHRAESWQIDYLQERVDEQNRQIRSMEEELGGLRAQASSGPDPEALAAERKEAKAAQRELSSARKEAERSERTIKSLRRSVSQWKTKYEQAQADLEELKASAVAAEAPAWPATAQADAAAGAGESPDTPGAAPAAPAAAPDPSEIP
ncbi:MAG: hypothetical protein ACQGVK_10410 [Myxococcota bacterium]